MYQAKLIGGPRGGELMNAPSLAQDIKVAIANSYSSCYQTLGAPTTHSYRYNGETEVDFGCRLYLFHWIDPNADAARREQKAKNRADKAEQALALLRPDMKEMIEATLLLIEHGHHDAAADLLDSHLSFFTD